MTPTCRGRISVVIPSYNYAHFIGDAIESVLNQTYRDVELIVSDNCSTDNTEAVLKRYAGDPRLSVYRNERNIGIIPNVNAGLRRASGEFVAFLSADDFFLPNHLERTLAVLQQHSEVDIVYTGTLLSPASGIPYAVRSMPGQLPFDYVDIRDELVELLTTTCHVCLPTALFRRSLFDELGAFDEQLRIAGDWELALRFATAGKRFAYLRDPSVCVRLHGPQASGVSGYVATGDDVRETLSLLDRYATWENHARFRGFERSIVEHLHGKLNALKSVTQAPVLAAGDEEKFAHIERRLTAMDLDTSGKPPGAGDLVSVIVRSAGRYPQLLESLDSISTQTHENWEIVVVEDGTPVSFASAVARLPYSARIRCVRTDTPLGAAAARNLGLRIARGRCIAYLDEGDRFRPEHLESLLAALLQNSAMAACGRATLVVSRYLDGTGTTREELVRVSGVFREPGEERALQVAGALPIGCVLHRREVLSFTKGFNTQLPVLEDWEFLLRLEQAGRIPYNDLPTVEIHRTIGQAPLAPHQIESYLPVLDAVHAAHPIGEDEPALRSHRVAHRELLSQTLALANQLTNNTDGLVLLTRVLCGRL